MKNILHIILLIVVLPFLTSCEEKKTTPTEVRTAADAATQKAQEAKTALEAANKTALEAVDASIEAAKDAASKAEELELFQLQRDQSIAELKLRIAELRLEARGASEDRKTEISTEIDTLLKSLEDLLPKEKKAWYDVF